MRINHRTGQFEVDTTGDPYGKEFWSAIQSRKYEPDTVGFLEDNLSDKNIFMDIGASNGAMTLIAASLGSEVISYEPDPTMFRILARNLDLNPSIREKVFLKNSGVSNTPSNLEFNANADSSILSSIVVGNRKSKGEMVSILALSDEINQVHHDKGKKLVIKMDIEGAEWRILHDRRVLKIFAEHAATVLLAVHPGFYRPHRKIFKGIDRIAITIWHLRNYSESLRTFRLITQYGSVSRTNLNPIRNSHNFAILVLGGYHEFILSFAPHDL